MANLNAPFGLKPIRRLGGGSITLTAYTIASGYNANIGIGSPVALTGTGRNIALAAAGTDPIGIFNGCKYVDSTGELRFSKSWPASTTATAIEAYVYDQPDLVCIAQITTAAEGDVGNNCDGYTNTTATFTAATGVSAVQVEGSFAGSGKTYHLLGLADVPNNAWGAYAKVEVSFAEHYFLTGAGVTA